MSINPYIGAATDAANSYGVPVQMFLAQIGQESGWNPNAYNSMSGATGIAQFLPSTASNAGYGISAFDPTDPTASLNAAAQYDSALYQSAGSWDGALSSYSGGAYTATSLGAPQGGTSQSCGAFMTWCDATKQCQFYCGSNTSSSLDTMKSSLGKFGSLFGDLGARGLLILIGVLFLFVAVQKMTGANVNPFRQV